MAVRSVSDSIARGDIEIGLAVGYESMSTKYAMLAPISVTAVEIIFVETGQSTADSEIWQ